MNELQILIQKSFEKEVLPKRMRCYYEDDKSNWKRTAVFHKPLFKNRMKEKERKYVHTTILVRSNSRGSG